MTDDLREENERLKQALDIYIEEGKAEIERLRADLAAANARIAEWNAKCDEVGVPHDPDGLVRHHRNNEAATQGAWKLTAQLAIEQHKEAEAERDRLQARIDKALALADEWAHVITYRDYAGDLLVALSDTAGPEGSEG